MRSAVQGGGKRRAIYANEVTRSRITGVILQCYFAVDGTFPLPSLVPPNGPEEEARNKVPPRHHRGFFHFYAASLTSLRLKRRSSADAFPTTYTVTPVGTRASCSAKQMK